MCIKHSALGMANGKGASMQSPQNAALMGKEQSESKLEKCLIFIQLKWSEIASSVGDNVTTVSAFKMFAPACSQRIMEKIQIRWRKKDLQGDGVSRLQKKSLSGGSKIAPVIER